jgi:hypothetical protein
VDGALGIVFIDLARRLTTKAPAYDLPEHRSARPVELGRQLLKLGTSHRIQAGIHADAVMRLVGPTIRWIHRSPPCALVQKPGRPNPW